MTLAALALACLLAITVCYYLVCWVNPFGRCRTCTGTGLLMPTGRLRSRPKPCRRCQATGRRLRIGRRLHNHSTTARAAARRIRDDAHR
ncbi:hypothetical protein [Kitasatospora sp. NPDC007106]|uniref:hypothetical protein n=1 Tax=Kitasatospora sp. NPDC007106 TaxID=3156914 RepID=UPI0033FC4385